MNRYVKDFLLRGLIFSGFGPIIMGLIYFILQLTIDNFTLSGTEVFLGIISTYFLAFIQAGSSIFNQIESWSTARSLVFHFSSIYIAYLICYVINFWIPFKVSIVAVFTAIFIVGYFAVWITVYLIVRKTSREMNKLL